jgi:hypothetical protein
MNARCWLIPGSALLGVILTAASGCQPETGPELHREISQLRAQIDEQKQLIETQQVKISKLSQQIQVARALAPDALEKVFYPEKIVIDTLSGGDDYDGKPGDDGVTVYVKPVDRDGDALKAAGDIRVQLYDLQNPPGKELIGEYEFPVDRVSRLWYGKLMTYHYTLRCPWQHGPPEHDEITVRVTFTDYLSQRMMTTQAVCTVKPAP